MKAAYGFVGPIGIAVTDSGWKHLSSFPDLAKRGGVRGEMTPLQVWRLRAHFPENWSEVEGSVQLSDRPNCATHGRAGVGLLHDPVVVSLVGPAKDLRPCTN